MAKMIPARIDESVVSAAERRVFRLLDGDRDTGGWTVLHSLGLARGRTGPFGEIDFVVTIPGEGILCLEIKGGRVSCEEGVWQTVDRHGTASVLRRSPFMQARDSMFALRRSIRAHFGSGSPQSLCPIGSAVVFPDVVCPPITPEFERSDVIDTRDLRKPISTSIIRIVRSRLREFQPSVGEKYPTRSQSKAILAYLRPDFDRVVAASVSLGRSEAKLMSLTEEQYDRLDELEDNPRCLFEGAAGTGKTLLALEYARRSARDGAKVLLVCFNRLLGEWLREQTENTQIVAGTWHQVLRGLITAGSLGKEFLAAERKAFRSDGMAEFFRTVYPFYGELALEELEEPFDTLVMDEAQDLVDQTTLCLINRIILGGLAKGTWAIFGDFNRQALYGKDSRSINSLLEYSESIVRAKLTLNCRNTRRIAEETAIIGGFNQPPFKLRRETGLPVEHRYWRTANDLLVSLRKTLRRLFDGGIQANDIVILSPRRLENSALATVDQICGMPVVDCSRSLDAVRDSIRYSTIHAFKGLESKVVILVDIDRVDDDLSESLMYVGMSRARGLLILLIQERVRKTIDTRIKAALTREFAG